MRIDVIYSIELFMFYIIFCRQLFVQKFYWNFSQNYGSLPTFPVLKNSDRNRSCSCLSLCTLRSALLEKTLPHTWKYEYRKRVRFSVFNEMSTNTLDFFSWIVLMPSVLRLEFHQKRRRQWNFTNKSCWLHWSDINRCGIINKAIYFKKQCFSSSLYLPDVNTVSL